MKQGKSKGKRKIGDSGKLSKEMQLERRQKILQAYSEGKAPDMIASEMKTSDKIVQRELLAALNAKSEDFIRLSPEQTFARYAAFQMGIIGKLQESYEQAISKGGGRQATAAISALKSQSDIYDKIFEKGIESGVIPTERNEKSHELLRGSTEEIKEKLREEARLMLALLDAVEEPSPFQSKDNHSRPNGNPNRLLSSTKAN